jgi:hypothetical protein
MEVSSNGKEEKEGWQEEKETLTPRRPNVERAKRQSPSLFSFERR